MEAEVTVSCGRVCFSGGFPSRTLTTQQSEPASDGKRWQSRTPHDRTSGSGSPRGGTPMTFRVWVGVVLSGPFGIITQVEKSTCNFFYLQMPHWAAGLVNRLRARGPVTACMGIIMLLGYFGLDNNPNNPKTQQGWDWHLGGSLRGKSSKTIKQGWFDRFVCVINYIKILIKAETIFFYSLFFLMGGSVEEEQCNWLNQFYQLRYQCNHLFSKTISKKSGFVLILNEFSAAAYCEY